MTDFVCCSWAVVQAPKSGEADKSTPAASPTAASATSAPPPPQVQVQVPPNNGALPPAGAGTPGSGGPLGQPQSQPATPSNQAGAPGAAQTVRTQRLCSVTHFALAVRHRSNSQFRVLCVW